MRIESSDIAFKSNYQSYEHTTSRQSLTTWSRGQNGVAQDRRTELTARERTTQVNISAAARHSLRAESAGAPKQIASSKNEGNSLADDPILSILKSWVERITGQPIKVFTGEDITAPPSTPALQAPAAEGTNTGAAPAQTGTGSGMAYDSYYLHEEMERLEVSAEGVIRTADGQEISFKMELTMERTYREEQSVSIRTGDAAKQDPLVINFAGNAAQLTDRFINFDLDANGTDELIPTLASGSAYLTFDRNKDGKIDNGSELFGPATNNGYKELALLDTDKNGWIDEGDEAFAQLGVWNPSDDEGLRSLTDVGIGALALQRVDTRFALRGNGNSDLGQLRETGLYLNENGTAGTMQEIDLSVR
jgi:hypothetical protein